MVENVRRVRLLVAVAIAGLLAFVAAWPSQSAATEPPPLYLARGWSSGGSPAVNMSLVVADGPRLGAHLMADGEDPATVEIVDSAGRVVVLDPGGKVQPTGRAHDPSAVQAWLQDSFIIRARGVRAKVSGDARIEAMHRAANQIPTRCVVAGDPSHRAGYLHNLWHRITGS